MGACVSQPQPMSADYLDPFVEPVLAEMRARARTPDLKHTTTPSKHSLRSRPSFSSNVHSEYSHSHSRPSTQRLKKRSPTNNSNYQQPAMIQTPDAADDDFSFITHVESPYDLNHRPSMSTLRGRSSSGKKAPVSKFCSPANNAYHPDLPGLSVVDTMVAESQGQMGYSATAYSLNAPNQHYQQQQAQHHQQQYQQQQQQNHYNPNHNRFPSQNFYEQPFTSAYDPPSHTPYDAPPPSSHHEPPSRPTYQNSSSSLYQQYQPALPSPPEERPLRSQTAAPSNRSHRANSSSTTRVNTDTASHLSEEQFMIEGEDFRLPEPSAAFSRRMQRRDESERAMHTQQRARSQSRASGERRGSAGLGRPGYGGDNGDVSPLSAHFGNVGNDYMGARNGSG